MFHSSEHKARPHAQVPYHSKTYLVIKKKHGDNCCAIKEIGMVQYLNDFTRLRDMWG
jgi:hypothetical protein